MRFEKKGLIYSPDTTRSWSQKYCMMPTPVHLKEKGIIRIFYLSTDSENNGRISFIDVNENDPGEILYIHPEPILDLGMPGCFDDCGVSPSSIVIIENKWYLYYVGFQRCEKVPYILFSGLAISDDGINFTRYSHAPIIDRSKESFISSAAPFVLKENETYRMWHWHGIEWTKISGKDYVSATIALSESKNLFDWKLKTTDCIVPDKTNGEFSVGRPWIIKEDNGYSMWYSVRYEKKLYRLANATSKDGIIWERKNNPENTEVSDSGWDSEMMCYPAVIKIKGRTIIFYNGNNNGASGFGYAYLHA